MSVDTTDINELSEILRQQVESFALTEIDDLLRTCGFSLTDFQSMPQLTERVDELNRLLAEELNDDHNTLQSFVEQNSCRLNSDQRKVYDEVIDCVINRESKLFFLDGPAETGKTYVYNLLLSTVRSYGKIAIALASTGLAALLLEKGRTAHSRLKIPIEINEYSSCFIGAQSDLGSLIKRTEYIVWDEAPVMNRYVFEAVDRTLRDITKRNMPFGGKVIVFGGDFRQILPVVKNGCDYDVINACLKRSTIWPSINIR